MEKEPTPKELLAVIRAHCLECCGGSRLDVRRCHIKRCKLWPYRRKETEKEHKNKKNACRQITIFELINENNKGA